MAAQDTEEKSGLGFVGLATFAITVIALALAFVVAVAGSKSDEKSPAGTELTANQTEGRKVFAERCSQCHALGASKAVSTVGQDLDDLNPPRALILDAIENGRARGNNLMPPGLVVGTEAQAVADYIVAVAGEKD